MGMSSIPREVDLRAYPAHVLDALPGIAFVIDAVGTVLYATERAAALVGREPADLVGESVLAFVDPESAWVYASAVAMATDYPTTYTGPLRVSLVDHTGTTRRADLWAHNKLDDPAIGGIVCLLTEETAAVGLAEAIASVAQGDPLDDTLRLTVRALLGHPVVADAAICLRTPTGIRWIAGPEVAASPGLPGASDHPGDAPEGPWLDVLESGVRAIVESVDELPPALAAVARDHGYDALWVEPVIGVSGPAGAAPATLVLWRRRPGAPSPNQLNSIHQAAGVVGVAIDRASALAHRA